MTEPAPLPPHSEAAEAGVLGCILLAESMRDPGSSRELFTQAAAKLTSPEAFFDLRHRSVWEAMMGLHTEGRAIDQLTLSQRLADTGNIESVGGAAYLASLPDTVPSAAMIDEYLRIMAEKWLARQTVSTLAGWAGNIQHAGTVTESQLGEIDRRVGELVNASSSQLNAEPKELATASQFDEQIFDRWTCLEKDEPGWHLPFEFPLKIRTHESTLMTGDNGSGKSSMLGHIALELGFQGARTLIASLEVPPWITYWILCRQLTGLKRIEREDQDTIFVPVIAWLNAHVRVVNFQGILHWQRLLDAFHWERRECGTDVFIVDSVMRIGIPDDDYAQQGIAAARFADFAIQTGAHVFLVVHENKGDGSMKNKVRGSKQWTDNAHNVIGMVRNESKDVKLDDLRQQIATAPAATREEVQKELQPKIDKLESQWESKFMLSKQRHPGSRQNGARHLWFHKESLQFHEEPGKHPKDYLGLAGRRKTPLPSNSELGV